MKSLAEVCVELRKLHEAATPGPWRHEEAWGPDDGRPYVAIDAGMAGHIANIFRADDARLVMAMRDALPRLLEAASELNSFRRALERVRKAIIEAEKKQGFLHCYKTAGCDSANIPSEVEDFLRAQEERDHCNPQEVEVSKSRPETDAAAVERLLRENNELRGLLAGAKDKYDQLNGIYNRLADTWNAFQAQMRPTVRNVHRAEEAGELARLLAQVFIGLAYDTAGLDDLIEVLQKLRTPQARRLKP